MNGEQHHLDAATRRARKIRRAAQAALLVPVLGVILLVSPVTTAVTGSLEDAGVSRAIIYIFGVWAGLIITALLLARPLADETSDTQ